MVSIRRHTRSVVARCPDDARHSSSGSRLGRIAILALAFAAANIDSTRALDTGLPQYPIGAETIFPARYPDVPGIFLYSYTAYYSANKFADDNGNSRFDRFHINVAGQAFRLLGVWDAEILGARPISFVVLPFAGLNASAAFSAPTPAGPMPVVLSRRTFGLGDMAVTPLLLNWQTKEFASVVGATVFAPTGSYTSGEAFNVGQNRWTFQGFSAFNWNPTPRQQFGVQVSYGIPTENTDTHYKNGQYVVVEASAGYNLTEQLGIDLNGYALLQTTDDDAPGIVNGNRSRLFSLGPQARYQLGATALVAKWQHEFGARNAPEGDRFWFQFVTPLYVSAAKPPSK